MASAEHPPQELGEEVVEPIARAFVVHGDDEEVLSLQTIQHRGAVGAVGESIAERSGELVEHRGVEEEADDIVGLVLEYLTDEKVGDVAIGSRERTDELGWIGFVAHGKRSELHARGPPLGSVGEDGRELGRYFDAE